MKIYFGHPSPFREHIAKTKLLRALKENAPSLEIFDPLAEHKNHFEIPRSQWPYQAIVEDDRKAIRECDAVVVWLPKLLDDIPSFYPTGSICEIAYAYEIKKPCYVLTDHPYYLEHPWIRAYATKVFQHSFDLAACLLKASVSEERRGHPRFYQLLREISALHSAKNHDYAGDKEPLSNLKACKELGVEPWLGVLVRMQDKWQRLVNLSSKEGRVRDEKIEDTAKDLAVYALLFIVLREEASK